MLNHPTLDLMQTLGFDGMIKGIKDLQDNPESQALDHLEWLGLLLTRPRHASKNASNDAFELPSSGKPPASRISIIGLPVVSIEAFCKSSPPTNGSASVATC